nr:hypothetical protein Iba_chr09aCG16240 [Ipomoea batatas]
MEVETASGGGRRRASGGGSVGGGRWRRCRSEDGDGILHARVVGDDDLNPFFPTGDLCFSMKMTSDFCCGGGGRGGGFAAPASMVVTSAYLIFLFVVVDDGDERI